MFDQSSIVFVGFRRHLDSGWSADTDAHHRNTKKPSHVHSLIKCQLVLRSRNDLRTEILLATDDRVDRIVSVGVDELRASVRNDHSEQSIELLFEHPSIETVQFIPVVSLQPVDLRRR